MEETRVVLLTAPDLETAEGIVETLVEEGVIACGNILPGLTSIYRWQGKVEKSSEVQVIMKTTSEEVQRLLDRVPELHPYDVPEVLIIPVESGLQAYLSWVQESVGRV